jgi:hypothetical protein
MWRIPQARRILDKIEFHYTPKHRSWLSVAETEINIILRSPRKWRPWRSNAMLVEQKHWTFTFAAVAVFLRVSHAKTHDVWAHPRPARFT